MISDSDIIKNAETGLKKELTVALIYVKLLKSIAKTTLQRSCWNFPRLRRDTRLFGAVF
jgi:hypothetical protein